MREERSIQLGRQSSPLHKWALVLAAGGARCIAHVGVLSVLEEHGLTPDLVVGSSAGAIVGSLYASGAPISQVKEKAFALAHAPWNFRIFGFPNPFRGLRGRGFFSTQTLSKQLGKKLNIDTFEELRKPLIVTAANLTTARLHAFSSGPLLPAVCASCCIPGFFAPVVIDGHTYVDGYVLAPLPISVARVHGAEIIVGVNVDTLATSQEEQATANPLVQSFQVANSYRVSDEHEEADLVIYPDLRGINYLYTRPHTVECIYEKGRAAALASLERIKALLSEPLPSPSPSRGGA